MSPIDRVLACLPDAKPSGRDRWRTWCRICSGNNSALSVGVGKNGGVVMRCFKSECSVESIVASIGLSVSDLFPERLTGSAPMRKRGLLTAGQALDLLTFEASLVRLAAQNLAGGHALTEADRERLNTAAARVAAMHDEVRA